MLILLNINRQFSIAMLNYRRVDLEISGKLKCCDRLSRRHHGMVRLVKYQYFLRWIATLDMWKL